MSFIKAVRYEDDPKPTQDVLPAGRGNWEATAYAVAALNAECEQIRGAQNGTRNDTLNRAAFNMAQLIAGGQISAEHVQGELVNAARAAGLPDAEVARTIRSGFAKGQQRARTKTPDTAATPSTAAVSGPPDPEATQMPRMTPVDWPAVWADTNEQEWLLEPLLPAGRLIALYSPPKVGKSLLMLELAVAISQGKDALGAHTQPTRVLYLDYENDPTTDIRARLQAMGHGPEAMNNIAYYSYPSLPPLDTPQGAETLMSYVQEQNAGLVIVDTISRAIRGVENENDTWLNLYRYTGLAMKRAGVTFLRLDHSGKELDKGQRGGSAKLGDVDAVWRMTEVLADTTYLLKCEAHRMNLSETELTLTRRIAPLAHQVETRHLSEVKRQAILDLLDAAGLPTTAGRDVCARVVKDAGIRVRTETLAAIIKARKGGAEDWSPTP